jgi:hypothetical protein
MTKGNRLWAVALIVFGVGLGLNAFRPNTTTAQPGGATGGPRYTVIETEGTNLLVTDNASNTLYFYTVDPDKTVGDELKLRGSLDLNLVGKPGIKPVSHKHHVDPPKP